MYIAAAAHFEHGLNSRARRCWERQLNEQDPLLSGATPAQRPLQGLSAVALAQRYARALADIDGLCGAHCVHELCMREELPVRIEAALERLWQCAAESIPDWLPMRYIHFLPILYAVAGRFRAGRRGRSNVYLVLLDYADRSGDLYGIYVGMSYYSPAQRFDQHKAGIRAAGSVLKRGLEVLTGPTLHLQRMARTEGLRIEAELAAALAAAGLRVEGGH
jgi:hypothetical protein